MRKTLLFIAIVLAACTKKNDTINNYVTQPAFAVNGISDVTFINNVTYSGQLNITVQYLDSAQQNVTLSVTGLPATIAMDTTWINSGIPTFSTILSLFDTTAAGAVPGTYPVTLTATTSSGAKKNFPFNIKVQPMSSTFLGKYNNCRMLCGSSATYTDSLYVDAAVQNKIWFTNFANSGNSVYGTVSISDVLTIPTQTSGGVVYAGGGSITINPASHRLDINYTANSIGCSLLMQ